MSRPLIFDFAVDRSDDNNTVLNYDNELNLNVVEIQGQITPLIHATTNNLELMTKTAQRRESDDELSDSLRTSYLDNIDNRILLEILTKTKAKPESDDEY